MQTLNMDQIMQRISTQQVMLGVWLWTLVTNHMYVTGNSIYLQTPKQEHSYIHTKLSDHGYKVGNSTCITFEYKGCQSAYVALMEEDDDIVDKMFEIVIGGWGNKKSVIRPKKHSSKFKATKLLSGVVHCNESRKFKVGWKGGDITVHRWTKPCKWEVLLSWQNTWNSVNYIGVTSGEWGDGDWIIFTEECQVSINRNTLWKNDITRKDTAFSGPIFIKSDIDSSHRCAMQCQCHSDCCYYTYNGQQRDCRGFSDIGASTTAVGTQLWIRY